MGFRRQAEGVGTTCVGCRIWHLRDRIIPLLIGISRLVDWVYSVKRNGLWEESRWWWRRFESSVFSSMSGGIVENVIPNKEVVGLRSANLRWVYRGLSSLSFNFSGATILHSGDLLNGFCREVWPEGAWKRTDVRW